ncbi:phosphotransferase [Bacillus spongiae]|uniref:Phosphotransferase n=1 Tax=Bacillus spongiae TaxID=2683610 RepID=A0ABU8HCL3_9BACI
MNSLSYHFPFKEICNQCQLGELIDAPIPISGGLLHKMYRLNTTKGQYAIKLLNPQIMQRPMARQNYLHSEQIAHFVSSHIPSLPALKLNGAFLHRMEDQFYLVFNWINGVSLKQNEIKQKHCDLMGGILADIHKTDFSTLGILHNQINNRKLIDWNGFLLKGQEKQTTWRNLLAKNMDKLYEWDAMAKKASSLLSSNMVLSHRDLDSKNVMWTGGNPVLIDWESAGYINPMQDLVETAIYWSGHEKGEIDKTRFLAFISGYKRSVDKLHADWTIVLNNGFLGKLEWLEYNLKRALWIECTDDEEQKLGTRQVTETINELQHYAKAIPQLVNWLNET